MKAQCGGMVGEAFGSGGILANIGGEVTHGEPYKEWEEVMMHGTSRCMRKPLCYASSP